MSYIFFSVNYGQFFGLTNLKLKKKSKQIRGAFNKFPVFFVQAFKIVVDSWKFSILLLYILWDDWPILWFKVQMNSYSSNWNTLYKSLTVTAGEFQKYNLDFRRKICNKILF